MEEGRVCVLVFGQTAGQGKCTLQHKGRGTHLESSPSSVMTKPCDPVASHVIKFRPYLRPCDLPRLDDILTVTLPLNSKTG